MIKTTDCKIRLHNALLFVACSVLARYTIHSIVMNLQLRVNRSEIKLHWETYRIGLAQHCELKCVPGCSVRCFRNVEHIAVKAVPEHLDEHSRLRLPFYFNYRVKETCAKFYVFLNINTEDQ